MTAKTKILRQSFWKRTIGDKQEVRVLKFSKKLAFITFTIALSFGVISVSHAGPLDTLDKWEACIKECMKTHTECGPVDLNEQSRRNCKAFYDECRYGRDGRVGCDQKIRL